MKLITGATLLVLALSGSNAFASGDLTLTTTWQGQNPAWSDTITYDGLISKTLLKAWRSASTPNGPICSAIWQALTPKVAGVGSCLGHIYTSGNTCAFDQDPNFVVGSSNGGVKAHVVLTNNVISFSATTIGTCDFLIGRDPQFTFTFTGDASVELGFSNNQITVGTSVGQISQGTLTGADAAAREIIRVGNWVGAFDGISSAITQQVNFQSEVKTAIAPANQYVQAKLEPIFNLAEAFGASARILPDGNGVHLEFLDKECLPGQTAGKFSCDGSTVCLDTADWSLINSAKSACTQPQYLGLAKISCAGFPAAKDRGPVPPSGWFRKGNYNCELPTAAAVEALVASDRNSLNACRLQWSMNCLDHVPACICPGVPSETTGPKCKVGAPCTISPAEKAALAACMKSPTYQACDTKEYNDATACVNPSNIDSQSAAQCAGQLKALNQAEALCGQTAGCSLH